MATPESCSCSICMEPFQTSGPKVPHLLPSCGHSFCKECLVNMIKYAPQKAEGGVTIVCPLRCKPELHIVNGLESLPRNWAIVQLLSSMSTFISPPRSSAPIPTPSLRPPPHVSTSPLLPSTPNHTIPTGSYIIQLASSSHVLDIDRFQMEPGAPLIHYAPRNTNNQKFIVTLEADATYTIVAVHSNLYLDVDMGSMDDDARVIQYESRDTANQRFKIQPFLGSSGEFTIVATHSSKALTSAADLDPSGGSWGLIVQRSLRSDGHGQRFRFIRSSVQQGK